MDSKLIRVILYSENDDNSLITTALSQESIKDTELSISYSHKVIEGNYDLVIAKIENRNSKILEEILQRRDILSSKVIFVIDGEDLLLAPTLAKLGFNDIFLFPDELFQFTTFINDRIESISLKETLDYSSYSIESLIGKGNGSAEKIAIAKKAAENPGINVFIYGESGTGKGLLANAIHNADKESKGPFVEVICTAIPDALLESELFGYEKGAFTDAKTKKIGLFELAENGTLFLDEIGDLNLGLQAKLLKVIEKKVFRRLGGVEDIPLKARIISATNKNLTEMIDKKLFRLDLYYRMSIVSISLEPLRKRKEEIIPQAEYLIAKFTKQYNKTISKIDQDVKDFMLSYSWPGNLREFRNTIEMAILMLDGHKINLNYFKNFIQKTSDENKPDSFDNLDDDYITLKLDYKNIDLSYLNKKYAKELLAKNNNNKTQTAKILKVSRPKLDNLLN